MFSMGEDFAADIIEHVIPERYRGRRDNRVLGRK